jgi:hypothetical protein
MGMDDFALDSLGLDDAEATKLAGQGIRAEVVNRFGGRTEGRGPRLTSDEIVYDRFSPRVCKELGYYVYRLVDPRNGETFYVGRGVNNRVFDHMEEAEEALFAGGGSAKTERINEIHRAGMKVQTVIHRYGLRDDAETAVVEAVLIEAYPNLTNQVSGAGTRAFGARSTDTAIEQLDLPPAPIHREKCLLLSLTNRWPRVDDDAPASWSDIYSRARHGWALDVKRAEKADWIVAHARGIIVGVFVAESWRLSTDPIFAAFPKPETKEAWGFIGSPAPYYAWDSWVGRRIPEKFRTRFGQRVRYVKI